MNYKETRKVLSIFIKETTQLNDVGGELVAIGVAYYEDDKLIDSFFGKCLDKEEVASSTYPTGMGYMEKTHSDPLSLTTDFLNFYKKYKCGSLIVLSGLLHTLIEMYNFGKSNSLFDGDNITNYPSPLFDAYSMDSFIHHVNPNYNRTNFSFVGEDVHYQSMSVYKKFKNKFFEENLTMRCSDENNISRY